jgi:hypothetical protein
VDNPSPRPLTRRPRAEARFVPDRRYTALASGGALGALAALVLTSDPAGRLLFGVAIALLLGYVVSDLIFSPRLLVSRAGLVVNTPLNRARLDWADVTDIRVETRIRRGLRSTTLEIEYGDQLVVLSRRALGTEPMHAIAIVTAFRPR